MADIAPVPVTITTTTTAKPGYKTTEWWGHVAALALTALFTSGALTNSTALNIAGIAATWLSNFGYQVNRSWVKTSAPVLLLLLVGALAPAQLACGSTAKSIESATGHAVVNCAETEARAHAVDVMTPVVQAVIQGSTSADGKVIDTAPIKSALGKLTKDTLYTEAWTILSCAAKTAFAALTHPAPEQPGAPAAAPFVVDPAAVAKAEADVMATIAPGARFALAAP